MTRLRSLILATTLAAFSLPMLAGLREAPLADLQTTYTELRQLHTGGGSATPAGLTLQRDAARIVFESGRLSFAAPVAGKVLAVAFEGQGRLELTPPTNQHKAHLARFTGTPELVESFKRAVFFFTDDTYDVLAKSLNLQPATGPDASDAIVDSRRHLSETFNGWWENAYKNRPPMRNLAARMLADLTDPESKGLFLAQIDGEKNGELLLQVSWNRPGIFYPQTPSDEEVVLLKNYRNDIYEWWAGFHLADEYKGTALPEHQKLLVSCPSSVVSAEVMKEGGLKAEVEMEVVPVIGARLLPMNLSGVLRISSVTDENGKKLGVIQEDRKLDSDPWIILDAPATPNQKFKLKLSYEENSTQDSRIINQKGNGLFYVTNRTSWVPTFGALDDTTAYKLNFRSPKKFKFLATGRCTRSETKGDFLETTWEPEIPVRVVGFNYGNFMEKKEGNDSFSISAYGGKEPPDELKRIKADISAMELASGTEHGDIGGKMGLIAGNLETTSLVGHAAATSYAAFQVYSHYFGALPFKQVNVTQQPIRGYGQSWPSLVFLPFDSLMDSATRNFLGYQESAEQRVFYNTVAVHEMAHQWWGHLVGYKTYHDRWLSEGLSEFATGLYLANVEPKKWDLFWSLKKRNLLSPNSVGTRPVDTGSLWLADQLDARDCPQASSQLLYDKGAYVMEMLHQLMRDNRAKDPDARFVAMLHEFVSTYSGKNASTEDFRKIVEKHAGEPMDWFFNQWVYGSNAPRLEFKYELKDGEAGKTVLVFNLTQSKASPDFQTRIPFFAEVNGQLRMLGRLKITGSTTENGEIPLPFKPTKILLDVSNSFLYEINQ